MDEPNTVQMIFMLVAAVYGLFVLVGWVLLPFIVMSIRTRIDQMIDQQQAILAALRERDAG